jgi:hypothetical protein
VTVKKKLIEVALPLDAINKASAREDLTGPRLIASRAAGKSTVIADPIACENQKEKQR